jgi:hypothetical protein
MGLLRLKARERASLALYEATGVGVTVTRCSGNRTQMDTPLLFLPVTRSSQKPHRSW